MNLYAGIDGGQSSTVALIADEQGKILGRGVAGPCDHIGQSADSPRFARALEGALGAALQQACLPVDSPFEAIVAGISGYEGAIQGVAPKLNAARVAYLHDARIAHAGAFEARDGIVVIAGTGSVAYGRRNGEDAMVGGWGYLFGDAGSAFAIARAALARAMRAQDSGASSELGAHALRFFERSTLREIARAFYLEEIDRANLAAFTTAVVAAAQAGETEANAVVDEATAALGCLAATCAARLDYQEAWIPVALAGGAFASTWFADRTREAISVALPAATVAAQRHEPAMGALLLAYKEGR